MQSQNGDVQLSVTLDTKGIKSDVQKLKSEIQKEINGKTVAQQQSIIDADSAVKDIQRVESEMDKLERVKKELSTGELSMDTQAELDRLQEIIDRKKQAEQATEQEVQAEQQVVENARSAAEVFQEVAETQARVAQEMEQMQNASQGVSEGQQQVVEDCSLAVREVERMKTALADTNAVAEDLARDLNMFEEGNKYSDEFLRLKSVAQDLTKEFNKSADELYKMEILGDIESQEYADMAIKAAELADQLREVNGMMADMRESGEAYTAGINNTELKQVERAYDAITNKITLKREAEKRAAQEARDSARQEAQALREAEQEQARLAKEAEKAGKNMQRAGYEGSRAMFNTAKNTKQLNKEMKETNVHTNKFKLNFLNILGSFIGIRSLYSLFSRLKSVIMDGVKNLAQFNDGNNETNESVSELITSLDQLENTLVSAFEPIFVAVAPALNYLIDLVTKAANAVAQMIAFISGASTWKRAKQNQTDFAKSLDKTGKSAKDAVGKLAAFDDLNVLGKDSDMDGGGAGGGVSPDDMWEEVPIEPWVEELFNKLKEMLEKLLPILKHIWDVFKQGFLDAAKDIKDRIANIIENLKKIKDHLIDIFTDPAVVNAMKGWFDSLIYLLGSILGAIALMGVSIAQNLVGGIEKYLDENKDRIKNFLVEMFNVWEEINMQVAKFVQAFARIFSVIGDENGQQLTSNLIGIFASAFGTIVLLASKIGRDVLYFLTQPLIDNQEGIRNAFDGLFGALATLTQGIEDFTHSIGDSLNELYDNHISPFIKDVTDGISEITGAFLALWDEYVQPILDEGAQLLSSVLNEYVMPIIQDVIDFVASLIDTIDAVWNALRPFISWIVTYVGPIVLKVIQGIMVAVASIQKFMLTGLSVLTSGIRILYEFIRDIFTVGIVQAFTNLKDNIIEFAGTIWEKLSSTWNNLWQRLNEIQQEIDDLILNLCKSIIENLMEFGKSIGSWIKNLWDTVVGAIKSAWDWLMELDAKMKAAIINFIVSVFQKIADFVNSIINFFIQLKDNLIELCQLLWEELVNIWENLCNAITEKIEALKNDLQEKWNNIKTKATEIWTAIKTAVSERVSALKASVTEKVSDLRDKVIEKWNNLKRGTTEIFTELKETVIKIWEALKNAIKSPLNAIIGGIEFFINAIINGINKLIEFLNGLHIDIPDWVPGELGGQTIGFAIEPLNNVEIPRLAQGAVIPPNKQFLAMLGDQKYGTNIEAPLDTIREAFQDVVSNMQVQNTGYAQMELDGETFARLIVPYVISELNREGYNLSVIGV